MSDPYERYGTVSIRANCGTCGQKDVKVAAWTSEQDMEVRLCPACLRKLAKTLEQREYVAERIATISISRHMNKWRAA